MIKNFTPQPYDGLTALPDYVTSPRFYTLVGYAPGDCGQSSGPCSL